MTEQLAAKKNEIRSLETRTLGEVTALWKTVDTQITQGSEQSRTNQLVPDEDTHVPLEDTHVPLSDSTSESVDLGKGLREHGVP